MKKEMMLIIGMIAILAMVPSACADAIIIDHTCTDLSEIPDEWVDAVQDYVKLHYAHTSHGGQLTTGLQRIENVDSNYSQARGSSHLPTEADALCIFDGQEPDTYITPGEYWDSEAGRQDTQDVIDHNPTINVSGWSWCCQLTSYSAEHVQTYLDVMEGFETLNPDVRFVYMTCNAQATGDGGYNRYLRNEEIRSWVRDHPEEDRVLFDFADLDSWWYNSTTGAWEHATYEYSSTEVPVEHPQFHGSQAGHTTHESCEQKGKAVWWMMARLAGWDGGQPEQPICGDVTDDGAVNTVDLMLLLKHCVNPAGNPLAHECTGDIDGNGHINVLDVRLLMGYINDSTGYSLNCPYAGV